MTAIGDSIIKLTIARTIYMLGVPIHLMGFNYLMESVVLVLDLFPATIAVSKDLYRRIAEENGTTCDNVERSIRWAIERAWQNNKEGITGTVYAATSRRLERRPSCKEFILTIALIISIETAY